MLTPRARLRQRLAAVFGRIQNRFTPNWTSRGGAKIRGDVVHTTESSDSSFEAIVSYFMQRGTQASAHYVVDALPPKGERYTRVARMVPESRKAWTALTANPYFVQYELIGRAARTRIQWLTRYRAQLNTLAALMADDVLQYHFPVVHGVPGMVGHRDLKRWGWPQTHTDPGVGFPWDVVLAQVKLNLAAPTPTPVSQSHAIKRSIRPVHAAKAKEA